MKIIIALPLIFLVSFAHAESKIISGHLQYWGAYKDQLTAQERQKARAYGQKNLKEGFWNMNLIPCNTNYWMVSLLPNATEQAILDNWRSQGKAFYFRARHFENQDGKIVVVDSSGAYDTKPLDWNKDWSVVEVSTP